VGALPARSALPCSTQRSISFLSLVSLPGCLSATCGGRAFLVIGASWSEPSETKPSHVGLRPNAALAMHRSALRCDAVAKFLPFICGIKLLLGRTTGMFGTFAFLTFPFGILVGYLWRDRISKAREASYWAQRERRHEFSAAAGGSTLRR
jgi:hypothetical protein